MKRQMINALLISAFLNISLSFAAPLSQTGSSGSAAGSNNSNANASASAGSRLSSPKTKPLSASNTTAANMPSGPGTSQGQTGSETNNINTNNDTNSSSNNITKKRTASSTQAPTAKAPIIDTDGLNYDGTNKKPLQYKTPDEISA